MVRGRKSLFRAKRLKTKSAALVLRSVKDEIRMFGISVFRYIEDKNQPPAGKKPQKQPIQAYYLKSPEEI
jgi:hypothetical protein